MVDGGFRRRFRIPAASPDRASERPWDHRLCGVRLQFCSVRVLRIYFAGPLFTPYERSFIDECAAALRADGFEVFVPHEHELATGADVTAASIFAKDWPGIEGADAMLAILDSPSVDDGTASANVDHRAASSAR